MIRVEVLDQNGAAAPTPRLSFSSKEGATISVRELIEMRVKDDWSRRHVDPDPVRWRIYHAGHQFLDVDGAVEDAITGFRERRYLLLINGKQAASLDDVVRPAQNMEVKFLHLVPLKGG